MPGGGPGSRCAGPRGTGSGESEFQDTGRRDRGGRHAAGRPALLHRQTGGHRAGSGDRPAHRRAHGGALSWRAVAGRGTTVRVALPGATERSAAGGLRPTPSAKRGERDARGKDAGRRRRAEHGPVPGHRAPQGGLSGHDRNNGRDASRRRKRRPFDVVITDIKMPGWTASAAAGHQEARSPIAGRDHDRVRLAAVGDRRREYGRVPVPHQERQERRDQARRRNALEMRKVRRRTSTSSASSKGHDEKAIIGASEEMIRVFKMVEQGRRHATRPS